MTAEAAGTRTEWLRRAQDVFPGGTVSVQPPPDDAAFVVERASGSKLYATDGREYLDYVMGSGPMLIGHAHPEVVAAVQEQAANGTTFFAVNRPAIVLAELLVSAIPCAEQVRLTNSGTESTFGALRIARAYTGREKILKFEGGYHGHHDYSVMSGTPSNPPPFPEPEPDAAGIPAAVRDTVLVAPFNDGEATAGIIADHREQLAAVIVEPLQRALPPVPGFLQSLRQACARNGVLLVFDEVVTGFRLAWGGAQERYGVVPDLACYGKVIAGGFAGGAIAGPRELVSIADPARRREAAALTGTLSGNPVSAVAGLATLRVLERERATTYPRLYDYGERLAAGMVAAFKQRGITAQAPGEGPVFQLFLQESMPREYRDTLGADGKRWTAFCHEMTRLGVYLNGGKLYCSTAHTDEDLDLTLERTKKALEQIM
jgi:glutamate-1-semialdehyde 2,1-aminomutase